MGLKSSKVMIYMVLNGTLTSSVSFIKGPYEMWRVLMESFVERLFRETYELDDIPDPCVGSPYPLPPSELLSLSSPLLELVREGGGDLGWFDCANIHTWSQGIPHDCPPGLFEVATLTPSFIAKAARDPGPAMPHTSREPANPGGGNLGRGMRQVKYNCSR